MIIKTKEQSESPKRQFCTFTICDRLFGVDILDVKEVNPRVVCAPIYHAPPEIRGYINIRGQIYLILDLRIILGFEPASASDMIGKQRIILFKSIVDESFGIIVDRINDVITIEIDKIENRSSESATEKQLPSNRIGHRSSDLSDGIAKLDDRLLVILNPHTLLRIASAPITSAKSPLPKSGTLKTTNA
ncbi:chemotaxis protein CheW [Desulfococcaceae bacterium HSG7]|nr:chemotaxis protein CheW [Desulfococcaceae bacterium HSG7]